ncbi:hypothetical protein ACUTAF_00920 [Pseudomonas sp. SP16.1]|uniref:hypothetical protein n=1 Tax=Pseudomonas sp. SP16.1 TaxID=3458854 RepID=UPI0040468625
MSSKLILTLSLSLLAGSAFAVPSTAPFPLVGEARDSQAQQPRPNPTLSVNGSERTPGQQRLKLAEDGAERTPGSRRIQLAEGGAERLLERRAHAG